MRPSILAVSLVAIISQSAPAQEKNAPPALVLQRGHANWVTTLALSRDARWLVTAGQAGEMILWETATGKELRRLEGHIDTVNAVEISDDGNWLVSCSGEGLLRIDQAADKITLADASVRLWDLSTGKQVCELKGHESMVRCRCVAISRDGKFIAAGGGDNTVRLWDRATGNQLHTLRHDEDGAAFALAFSADGKSLVTADDRVRFWDLATGKQTREFQPHNPAVKTFDSTEKVTETVAGETVEKVVVKKCIERTWITHLSLCNDRTLVTIGDDGRAISWDIGTGKPVHTRKLPAGHAAISHDGKTLFVAQEEPGTSISMLDLATGKELRVFHRAEKQAIGWRGLCISQDGKWLLATETRDALDVCARMWEIATGKEVRVFRNKVEGVNALTVSDDGKRLVTASGTRYAEGEKTAQLWDLTAGKQVRVFKGHQGSIYSVAISADGKVLATGGADSTARSWNADTGRTLHIFPASSTVYTIALSANGKVMIAGNGPPGIVDSEKNPEEGFAARCYDLDTGKIRHVIREHWNGVNATAVSPDGKLLASGQYKKLRLWELDGGKLVKELKGHEEVVAAMTFSRDGKWLVTGSSDETVRVWDVVLGTEVRSTKHKSDVTAVALSRDHKLLASGCGEHLAHLWDFQSGKELRVFKGHTDTVTGVAFLADNKRLATSSLDGTTRLWNAETGEELCRLVTLCDGTWIVFDAAGRFDSDTDNFAGLHWVRGMQTAPLRCHDRGLLAKYLGANQEPLLPAEAPFAGTK